VLAVGAEAKAGKEEEEQAEDMTHKWNRTDEKLMVEEGVLEFESQVGEMRSLTNGDPT
jgi:hypothetical protein